jgi:TonB family protein
MTKSTKRNLNYPLAISVAIHGLIIIFFSLLAVDLPKKTAMEQPIHIKKIIFEKKKAAPAKETNSKKSIEAHKPTHAAARFQQKKKIPTAQAKPRNTEPLNRFVPISRVPDKPNRFQKTDRQAITPISFVHQSTQPTTYVATSDKPKIRHIGKAKPRSFSGAFSLSHQTTQPATYIATGSKSTLRPIGKVNPKSFSGSLSISAIKPVTMAVTTESFSPKPFAKPMQMAAIPIDFVNDLPSESSLAKLSPKTTSGMKNGIPDSSGHDLNALRKGYSSQVWARIADAKFYPRIARKRGMEGKPVVEFELRKDGQLMNHFIARSSSSKILDKAAMDAVKNGSPYPGIPKLLKLKSIRFKLPISFILNEP